MKGFRFDRRTTGWLVVALSALALLLCSGLVQRDKTFSQYCVSPAQWQQLLESRTPTGQPLLSTLCFGDHDLMLDAADDRFYYSLIEGDAAAWDPPVHWRALTGGVQLAILQTEITPESIAANADIQLLAYTNTEYELHHLSCTTLPLLNISGVDVEALTMEDRTSVAMQIHLFDNRAGAVQRAIDIQGSIHVRGQTAARFPKKAYKLTLLEQSPGNALREWKGSLLGMRQDGDWQLYAAYNDQERVRNVFSSRLWWEGCAQNNAFGVKNGMEYRYVELFWNGAYAGLYAIGHPIDDLQLRVDKDLLDYTEYRFKKFDWVASEIGVVPGQPFMYGYELETLMSGAVPVPDEERRMVARESEAWQMLVNYYAALRYDTSKQRVRTLVDMDNAIDIYLFYGLIQGVDNIGEGTMKNTYITFKQKAGDMVALYTPWDMDLTWGNAYGVTDANSVDMYRLAPTQNLVMDLNPVYCLQQLGDTDINGDVQWRYAALRAGVWSDESVLAMLDEMEADIYASGAYARDVARWPDSTQQDVALGLSLFKAYVLQRLAYMDAFVAELG